MNTCKKQTTLAVIVAVNGKIYTGTNHCENQQSECPRNGIKTGEGYELCRDICKQTNHAEVNACILAGEDAKGATLYLFGHTYCCDNCKRVMKEYGISNTVIIGVS